jgi:protein gp37
MPTGIEWCDETWNPIRGCSRVSEGCRNCYAEKVAVRFDKPGLAYEWLTRNGRWNGVVRFHADKLTDPIRWRRPRRIFVNSMSDLFHEHVSDEWLDWIFAVMALAQWHTFIVLTKRPERMRDYLTRRDDNCDPWIASASRILESYPSLPRRAHEVFMDEDDGIGSPLPNLHLGVSVEDQETADERIPLLLQTPAEFRIVSYEPALGPVDFHGGDRRWLGSREVEVSQTRSAFIVGLDQVIVGGESGPGARPCDVEWIRSTVDQCRQAHVACFVKQLGAVSGFRVENGCPLPGAECEELYATERFPGWHLYGLRDSKGGDMAEFPEDLRVRQHPKEAR